MLMMVFLKAFENGKEDQIRKNCIEEIEIQFHLTIQLFLSFRNLQFNIFYFLLFFSLN